MSIRTESEIILGANLSADIANLIEKYLDFWVRFANGCNGVHLEKEFSVILKRPTKQGFVNVRVIQTKHCSREEPRYYDSDSDYYVESWGASNISGYDTVSWDEIHEKSLMIPQKVLFFSEDEMKADVLQVAENDKKDKAEKARLQKIESLKSELKKLETNHD